MESKHKTSDETNFKTDHIILGIDEAGRGPVLGPMVYACCYWAEEKQPEILKNFKFADSKVVKEADREKLYDKMCLVKTTFLDYEAKIIHPQEISNKMLRRSKISLNKISEDAAFELVRNALNKGVNVKEVYVDTVGPPEKYKSKFEYEFKGTGITFTVCPKADSLYPVVSAASIVAKVNRDRVVKEWEFKEFPNSKIKIDKNYGCGYPGDPLTKKWMDKNCDLVFGYPSFVRFSWKTTVNVMKNKSKKLDWGDNYLEEEDEGKTRQPYMDFFKANNKKKKFDFFENNSLIYRDLK